MTKQEFELLSQKQNIYLDGATGSNLVKAGMPGGVCPEAWILEHPQVFLDLQRAYVDAGTDILYSPTFTANRVKLAEYGLDHKMEEMIDGLVALSREAAESAVGRKVYVAGDLTMTGQALRPMGNLELEELIDIYKEQIRYLEQSGVDLLVVETMMSLAETRAALIAAKEVSSLPIMATMTFEADGRALYGTDAKTAAIVCESLGACAFGANCSTGPAAMEDVIREIAGVTTIPIIAKPNAGLPFLDSDGTTCYDMRPDTFVEEMGVLIKTGASILGGCCGTSPDYIRALTQTYGRNRFQEVPRRPKGVRYLTSERKTVSFGLNDPFMVIGERINPTGKKALQAQLREGSMDMVLRFAEEQETAGAQILDINMGMSGIDEKQMMLRAMEEVTCVSDLPLSLDSSYVDVLEAALRHYPGRALINSISLESEKFEKLLPIAAKYGAMFILLPLSDKGLPENLEEKKSIMEKIYNRATFLGMRKEDIVVDGLVATIGANKNAALECLETVRYAKEKGFATVCGLSNISFGMPERSYVNTAFLTLMIREGLTMAIANPSQELLMSCALATDLLLNKDNGDIRYIEYAQVVKEKREEREAQLKKQQELAALSSGRPDITSPSGRPDIASPSPVSTPSVEGSKPVVDPFHETKASLYKAVMKGNRNGIAAITRDALSQGEDPSALLNEVLLPAINEVGELFDKGKYFLPQLIASAEAMKNAIEILEPLLLKESTGKDLPIVVIATVEGDIHDIGKNLVALMLKNYGFQVIDLGKDVPAEKIIQTAREHNAKIIALSALMTTTMQRMREVVEEVKKAKLPVKVMIGGAVITQEYADEIGADGYSKDAADAVKLAKRLNSEV